ncbi:unknown protein [Waddlia chondrophila 2032/99]|uniref:Uncharacterized protein n=1 Tax=Waddlia chondrophila 2032/99 TaxID=765953 RepID=F8LE95_9BACT|nr:unknown protein [Waddlia chondrophila 2032/99]
MEFEILYKKTNKKFDLIYHLDEYSFDVEPNQEPGTYSLMINDLFLELDEKKKLMYVWGLCPLEKVKIIRLYPKKIQDYCLRVMNCENLTAGIPYKINNVGRWDVSLNSEKGWVCIGNPGDNVSFIQFAPGSVLALEKEKIVALWLLPRLY